MQRSLTRLVALVGILVVVCACRGAPPANLSEHQAQALFLDLGLAPLGTSGVAQRVQVHHGPAYYVRTGISSQQPQQAVEWISAVMRSAGWAIHDQGTDQIFLGGRLRAVAGNQVALVSFGQGSGVDTSPYRRLAHGIYVQIVVSPRSGTPEWSHL